MSVSNIIFYSLFLLNVMTNCQQKNKLAQNEADIIQEVAELENIPVKVVKNDGPGFSHDIPEKPRIVDKNNPPIILDILAARSDVRKTTFTDLYNSIKYIPVRFAEQVDPVWNQHEQFDFLITPNNIIASHYFYGIAQFDLDGNFINQIAKSNTYYTLSQNRKFPVVNNEKFIGVKGQVHALGDRVYYQFHDAANKKGMWMEFNAAPGALSGAVINAVEEDYSQPKGKLLGRFESKRYREYIAQQGANNIFPLNENEWASSFAKSNSSKQGSFIISLNLQGDTITKFKDHDPIRNYSGALFRDIGTRGTHYNFKGVQYIKQGYNDTIYTMLNASQLRPKYVIDFGDKGIKSNLEAIDSRFPLKDKFIIDNLIETSKYVFIRYTQDFPAPKAAKNGTLLYNACIYDKVKQELFHVYIDQPPYLPKGKSWPKAPVGILENNYDQGPVFWPMNTTAEGSPFQWIKGMDLKSQKNAGLLKSKSLSLDLFRDDDYLIMIAQ